MCRIDLHFLLICSIVCFSILFKFYVGIEDITDMSTKGRGVSNKGSDTDNDKKRGNNKTINERDDNNNNNDSDGKHNMGDVGNNKSIGGGSDVGKDKNRTLNKSDDDRERKSGQRSGSVNVANVGNDNDGISSNDDGRRQISTVERENVGRGESGNSDNAVRTNVDEGPLASTGAIRKRRAQVPVSGGNNTGAAPSAPEVIDIPNAISHEPQLTQSHNVVSFNDMGRSGAVTMTVNVNNVSVGRVTARRADLSVFELKQQFTLVEKLGGYVVYEQGVRRIIQEDVKLSGPHASLFESSISMFCPDRAYVLHTLNENFFCSNDSALKLVSSVPLSNVGVSDYGIVNEGIGMAAYFNGVLGVVAKVMNDNSVLCNVAKLQQVALEFDNYIKSTYLADPPSPSLVLSSVHSNIRWLRNYIDALNALGEDRFHYYYGISRKVFDSPTNVKLLDYFAVNVDQYYAAIVNINARFLRSDVNTLDRVQSIIKAYAYPHVSFDSASISSITPFNIFDPDTATLVILMCFFLLPSFNDSVVEDNLAYFESCNMFSYEEKFMLCSLKSEKADQTVLVDFLASRINMCNFSYVSYIMALEISPVFQIFSTYPIAEVRTVEVAVVLLVEFYLFAITFPNCFDRIKGIIQDSLFSIFKVLLPIEYLTLQRNIGYTYTINGGNIVFDAPAHKKFINDTDYLGGTYPSIFADLTSFNVPGIHSIMSLFVPIGERVDDINAVEASFPRLDKTPSHYIPFKLNEEVSSIEFSSAVTLFCHTLKAVLSRAQRNDNISKSSPSFVIARRFLDDISGKFHEFDVTLNSILPSHYRVRANTMFNIGDAFNGDFRSFKRTDYCLTSKGRMCKRLYRVRRNNLENKYRISTSVVWQMYGHGSSVFMRKSGANSENIAYRSVEEKIVIPDESEFIRKALNMYSHYESKLIPISFTSAIFSDQILPDLIEKKRIRKILTVQNVQNSLLSQVCVSVANTLGINVDDCFNDFQTDSHTVSTTPVCIDPTIRRVSLQFGEIVPYDPAIDNACLENVICTLPPVYIARLRVGLQMIVNNAGFKPRRGLRFCRHTNSIWEPDFKPSPSDDEYLSITYTSSLFVNEMIDGMVRLVWNINGGRYFRDFPKTHLIVPKLGKVYASHVEAIIKGVHAGWLMVDVEDQNFIPVITTSLSDGYEKMCTILRNGTGRLVNVEFTDSVGTPAFSSYIPRGNETFEQYIFPLNSVSQNYFIGCLYAYDSDNTPPGVFMPAVSSLDTGGVDAIDMPIFSDNRPKVTSNRPCLSNVVSIYTKNLSYTSEIKYSRDVPQVLFSLYDNSNYS